MPCHGDDICYNMAKSNFVHTISFWRHGLPCNHWSQMGYSHIHEIKGWQGFDFYHSIQSASEKRIYFYDSVYLTVFFPVCIHLFLLTMCIPSLNCCTAQQCDNDVLVYSNYISHSMFDLRANKAESIRKILNGFLNHAPQYWQRNYTQIAYK